MRILHISDTHGCHRRLKNLPEADVIVHSGDITMTGGADAVGTVTAGDIVFSNGAVLTGGYEMNLRPYSLIDF